MISIRTAGEEDAAAITRLVNAAFLVEQFFIERDRTNRATILKLIKAGKFLLAEDESNLVGCVYVEVRGERGYFGMLSVEPSLQQKGIGSRLIESIEKYFREAGCRFIDLKIVDVRTDLYGLYHRWGYADSGTAPYDDPTPTKIPVHFILMSKRLC